MSIAKKNLIASVCFVSLIAVFVLVVSNYVSAQNSSENVETIKIPPPIEGVIPPAGNTAQSLKKTDIAILTSNGSRHKYTVEIASASKEVQIGMMFRHYVPENTGMLFVFKSEGERSFWMKNTLIPLDIIFIRKDGVITHIHHMAEEKSLKPISSNSKIIAVLEIAGGEAEILGINVGDRILYKDF